MTLQQFLEQNNGKYVEVAGSPNATNQCVDLANLYLRDVLNHTIVEWTNAVDFPSKLTDFQYILNTPTGVPQEGDLVIWGGTYGHIAICIEATTTNLKVFEQNNPLGSPCHVGSHGYSNVLGWLHSKSMLTDTIQVNKTDFENLVTKSTKYDAFVTAGYQSIDDVNKKVSELENEITNLKRDALSLNEQMAKLTQAMDALKQQDVDMGQKELEAEKERDSLQNIITGCLTEINLPTLDKNGLPAAIQELVGTEKRLESENLTLANIITELKVKLNNKCPSIIEQILNIWRGR